ncbi:G-protein coupled receptor Mth2-like [Zerene cesonia]|uniref:G-protein coupled receptor Mth2-like n=1 Tax=Zerene cesonia TaxID=33412 RepID=UPI0018E519BF|nr:G-protein coupled receptor Mth2-like [Zerene cesonia]
MWFVIVLGLLTSVNCEKMNAACCLPEQGFFVNEENVCENTVTKIRSPTRLPCNDTEQISMTIFNFTIKDDGTLTIVDENFDTDVEYEKYCIASNVVNETEGVLVFCAEEEDKIIPDNVLEYCMIVSVIFLTFTAIIYCILPEIRDLQGKSIINFCLSLATGLGILVIMKLMEYSDMNLCAVRGFLTYFFLLASFFWMNAIALQIMLYIKRPFMHDYGWRPFIWYALYAWGCPTVLTICMAIVNFHPGKHQKPGIGLNSCWFFNKRQQWYYMYSVMSIIIILNIIIFIYISIYMWRQKFSSTHVKAMRYKFMMSVRLFVLLGLPWISEMISTLSTASIVWVVLDVFNTLQGPVIFLVLVVFRQRVVKALYKRGYLDCISGVVERYLAVADDDEDIVQHTADVALDDRKLDM